MDLERQLQDKHYLEVLETAADVNHRRAFAGLQFAQTESDRFYYCEELEIWAATQVLLQQRAALISYASAVLRKPACGLAQTALKNYLGQITGGEFENLKN